MRGLVILAAVAAACVCVSSHIVPAVRFQATRQAPPQLSRSIQEFALDLSIELQDKGTVVFSPLSISNLLLVLLLGSGGATFRQLFDALMLPPSEPSLHSHFQTLFESAVSSNRNVTLNVANGLFIQEGTDVLSEFTNNAKTYYKSSVFSLDFSRKAIVAKDFINSWVSNRTHGMIPELLQEPLSRRTNFVAANTVYFNGTWANPFIPDFTRVGDFNTGTETIKVNMMQSDMNVPYVNIPDLDAHMISLPYKGNQYAMFILMPKGNVTNNLQDLEYKLDSDIINRLINNMTSIDINVSLPKMRLSYKASLKRVLTDLHIDTIFSRELADFSRLTASKDVWVDDIVHETVVEVSETGTVAAAATAFSLNRIGNSRTFYVNRPAIFFIRDLRSGLPLFWGRLIKPEPLQQASGRA
ncbi:leukocyte elastase inhibitor-like isoform X1 [Panulirus ornatus]